VLTVSGLGMYGSRGIIPILNESRRRDDDDGKTWLQRIAIDVPSLPVEDDQITRK
jgi:hypothetical protein